MRYWYDTEFIETGAKNPIDLISIGMVAEDGREYYAISTEFNAKRANDWVKENVLKYIPPRSPNPAYESPRIVQEARAWKPRGRIADDLLVFCDPVTYGPPEFWGYYSAYDHVVLCQLFGSMMHLPDGWPYYTRDLRQWADSLGITEPLDQFVANEAEHHALADARWTKAAWEHLNAVGKEHFQSLIKGIDGILEEMK